MFTPSKMTRTEAGQMVFASRPPSGMFITSVGGADLRLGFGAVIASAKAPASPAIHAIALTNQARIQAESLRMFPVFFWGHVFKILRSVVRLVGVTMIYLRTVWADAQESLSDQRVNLFLYDSIVTRKLHLGITPHHALAQDAPGKGVSVGGIASDSTEARNTVPAFVTRYGRPHFSHLIYSLRGKDTI